MKYQKIQENSFDKEKLESQISFYQPYNELLEGIEDYIRQQEEEDELPENGDYEEDELEEDTDENNVKLETTKAKDIQDFVKDSEKELTRETGLMEKNTFGKNFHAEHTATKNL